MKKRIICKENIFEWLCLIYFFLEFNSVYPYQQLIILIGIILLGYFQIKNKDMNKKIYHIIWLGYFIYISISGKELSFENSDDLVIYIIITSLTFCITFIQSERENINFIAKIIEMFFSLVISFSFFGYKLLVKDIYGSYYIVFYAYIFLTTVFWSYELLNAVAILMKKIEIFYLKKSCEIKINSNNFAIILFIIFCVNSLLMSIIFYPGMISYEGIGFYNDAVNISDIMHRTDVRSFFYTLIWVLYYRITYNCYIMTVILVLLMALLWAHALIFLCKNGLSQKVALIFAIIWSCIPMNMFMTITLFKDNPFTICIFFATISMAKILISKEDKKIYYIELCASLILMSLFRPNAVLALFSCCVFVLIAKFMKIISKKLVISVMCALIIVITYKVIFLPAMQVQNSPAGYKVAFMLNGIWECVYQEKELTQEIQDYMFSIVSEEELKEKYVENYFNYFFWENQYENENIKVKETIKAYVWCFKHYPMTMIKGQLKKCFNTWSVFVPHSDTDYKQRIFMEVVDNNLGWNYIDCFEKARNVFYEYYKNKNIINSLFGFLYRGGWNICVIVMSLWCLVLKDKKKLFLMLGPIFGNTLSIIIACCFTDYRYVWPLFVISNFFALCTMTVLFREYKEKNLVEVE